MGPVRVLLGWRLANPLKIFLFSLKNGSPLRTPLILKNGSPLKYPTPLLIKNGSPLGPLWVPFMGPLLVLLTYGFI